MFAPFEAPIRVLSATRDLIEAVVRRRVRRLERVRLLDRCELLGPVIDGDRVRGIRIRRRGGKGEEEEIESDLVIDATGRGSRAPRWLAEAGFRAPPERVVDAKLGYASAIFEGRPLLPQGWKAVLEGPSADSPRGGGVFPIEDERCLMTLAGFGEAMPPGDPEGFWAAADRMRSELFAEVLSRGRRISAISTNRSTANRMRAFHRMRRLPRGMLYVGDTVCAFNPLYAQGMSVSAAQALEIGRALESNSPKDGSFVHAVQRRIHKTISAPWQMATLEDFRQCTGRPLATALLHRYMDAVQSLATRDPAVSRSFFSVIHLLSPQTTLMGPRLLGRALLESFQVRTPRA